MGPDQLYWIYSLYVFALVVWTFMVLVLKLFRGPAFFMVFIPYLVFLINIYSADKNDDETESVIFTGTFLSIGLIVMVALLGWFKNMGGLTKNEIALLLLSLALALISHIELGLPAKYINIYRHYRSILQTFSIVLFLIVIINYFIKDEESTSPDPETPIKAAILSEAAIDDIHHDSKE